MLLIDCPWCGPRAHVEFSYGGDANRARPAEGEEDDRLWYEHVYQRSNAKGLHWEYWQHVAGCRQWVAVRRDTTTHVITETRDPAEHRAMMTKGDGG